MRCSSATHRESPGALAWSLVLFLRLLVLFLCLLVLFLRLLCSSCGFWCSSCVSLVLFLCLLVLIFRLSGALLAPPGGSSCVS